MEQQPRTLQLFSSGRAQFAVVADAVMAIIDWREPAALPHAPDSVLGVVSVRGRMLTVLDLAQLLNLQKRADGPTHILALNGDEQLALAIDGVGETLTINAEDTNGAAEGALDASGKLLAGVLNRNGDAIRILNVKELFPTAIQGRERRRRRF